ncbi:citrate transporter [Sandaracinomonas limnophila]|uniref:Citrate transporter n=1 Tax=Sandaracinomonas limnophila TaxID=1862386 RepID=A0A437PNY9_9BACT|nr:citrate:proton symporter [Sandaracinomonas limnophila]RVU24012.1 citrate transporter [Sandaracinomonas limnophila]
MAIAGFLTILFFLVAIISKRISVITALVLIPIASALIMGIPVKELGPMMLDGIKQVAPTGIMLVFAVLYFAIMLDVGLFDPVIRRLLKIVGGDPLKVILGTAILTMLVHLDGDGTATFMIVISAFLPLYERLQIKKVYLAGIVALAVGPIHLVPWSGTSARAISTLQTDATHIFNPNLIPILGGILWVLFVAYFWGKKERARLGIQEFFGEEVDLKAEPNFKRPRLIWFNALLTITLIFLLIKGFWPTPVLFLVGAMLALIINFPNLSTQSQVLKSHGTNIFSVSSMIFAAGIFSGILTGSKMIEAMATAMVEAVPAAHANWIPTLTALTSVPASLLFTPDAYYFGVVPVLAKTVSSFGMDALQIGRAALLGQMTVGFPISPLTASTFLLISLTKVELGEHQKNTFLWAVGTSVVMTIFALLAGSLTI